MFNVARHDDYVNNYNSELRSLIYTTKLLRVRKYMTCCKYDFHIRTW